MSVCGGGKELEDSSQVSVVAEIDAGAIEVEQGSIVFPCGRKLFVSDLLVCDEEVHAVLDGVWDGCCIIYHYVDVDVDVDVGNWLIGAGIRVKY
jgi:hypothetical protein